MRCLFVFLAMGLLAGCAPASDPAARVAALDVPLANTAERASLAVILLDAGKQQNMQVDILWPHLDGQVWAAGGGHDSTAMVIDAKTRAWVVFLRGEDQDRARGFQAAVTEQIKRRWPTTRTIPINPDGSLPPMHPHRVS